MTAKKTEKFNLSLEYSGGTDDPKRGIYRKFPLEPRFTNELTVAIRSDRDPHITWADVSGDPPQVHLAGSARALEALGRYLIGLARLKTADPEPYGSFDRVRNADGGAARLLPRRFYKKPTK